MSPQMIFTIHSFMGGHGWFLALPLPKSTHFFHFISASYVATFNIILNSEKKRMEELHVNYDSGHVKTNKKYTYTHTKKIAYGSKKP